MSLVIGDLVVHFLALLCMLVLNLEEKRRRKKKREEDESGGNLRTAE